MEHDQVKLLVGVGVALGKKKGFEVGSCKKKFEKHIFDIIVDRAGFRFDVSIRTDIYIYLFLIKKCIKNMVFI